MEDKIALLVFVHPARGARGARARLPRVLHRGSDFAHCVAIEAGHQMLTPSNRTSAVAILDVNRHLDEKESLISHINDHSDSVTVIN